uniref:AMMECR1 domain-containing protein n=1 Tax=Caenorhabditis japonica TaxID=281687 RepID=A0A8R1I7B2_CAEJA
MTSASVEMAVYCFDVISAQLNREKEPPVPREIPNAKLPLFVTWKKGAHHDLRGCIGTFSEDLRLATGLNEYAKTSAFHDTRFNPIGKGELSSLQCGVSLLVNFERIQDYHDWTIGMHGVRMNFDDGHRSRSAVFLPEVAQEQGWDQVETIDHLIRKSGYAGHIDESLRQRLRVVRFQSSKIVLDYKDYITYKQSRGLALPN